MKNRRKKIKFVFLIGILLISLCFTGCSKLVFKQQVLLTTKDEKITVYDAMYYIYIIESLYAQLDETYSSLGLSGYWDEVNEDGITNREYAKDLLIEKIKSSLVYYDKAIEEGLTLTQEEQDQVDESAQNYFDQLTKKQVKKSGLTLKKLKSCGKRDALAMKFYQNLIDSYGITKEDVQDSIKPEDYQEFQTQCMIGEFSNEEEKKQVYEKMEQAYEQALAGEDFIQIVTPIAEINKDNRNFLLDDETKGTPYYEAAIVLQDGEISPIIEEENDYVIIRMMNRDARSKYDEAIQNAIQDKNEALAGEQLEQWSKDYQFKVHNNTLSK